MVRRPPGRPTFPSASLRKVTAVAARCTEPLALNEEQVERAGFASAVEERGELDICDLAPLADGEFDAVLAYGGPLSYAFERAETSLARMVRITRSGGYVVASVMALPGTLRFFFGALPEYAAEGRLEVLEQVVATGDNRYDVLAHPCRLFRWREVEDMARRLPCTLVGGSASNFLTCGDQEVVKAAESNPTLWTLLLDWEEQMCAEPGALDGGTHLLFALQRL